MGLVGFLAVIAVFFIGKTVFNAISGNVEKTAKQDAPVSEKAQETLPEDTQAVEPVESEPAEKPGTAPAQDEVAYLTLSAIGDCALGKTVRMSESGSFLDYYDKKGKDYFFSNVKDIFEADDLTLANLECVLSNSNDKQTKEFNIRGSKKYAAILTSASIEAVTMGNNHTMDYGEKGLADTKAALDKQKILWALDDQLIRYTTDDGITVGVVSVKSMEYEEETMKIMLDGIKTLEDEGTNLIIVSVHWGIEKDYDSNEHQSRMAHELIDNGADLVLGCHPHVLQGVEEYKGKMIVYSLGNFCFGANKKPSDIRSMIYQQSFTFVNGEVQTDQDVQIIPCHITSTSSSQKNDYCPKPVDGSDKREIIDLVNRSSSKVGQVQFDDDGRLMTGSALVTPSRLAAPGEAAAAADNTDASAEELDEMDPDAPEETEDEGWQG